MKRRHVIHAVAYLRVWDESFSLLALRGFASRERCDSSPALPVFPFCDVPFHSAAESGQSAADDVCSYSGPDLGLRESARFPPA